MQPPHRDCIGHIMYQGHRHSISASMMTARERRLLAWSRWRLRRPDTCSSLSELLLTSVVSGLLGSLCSITELPMTSEPPMTCIATSSVARGSVWKETLNVMLSCLPCNGEPGGLASARSSPSLCLFVVVPEQARRTIFLFCLYRATRHMQ